MSTITVQRAAGDGNPPGLDLVARAVSDPSRRRILELIRNDEFTVGQIAERFPVSRPAISQHLRVLEEAELVEMRASGRHRYYRCRPEGLNGLRSWLEEFWTDRLDRLKDEVEREHRQRVEFARKNHTDKNTDEDMNNDTEGEGR